MVSIQEKQDCSGCSACAQRCPKHCITMTEDNEGFLYPVINKDNCIDCGLCEKVCHELHPYNEREPLKVLAAINKDERVRLASSSGGIFYLLAEKTISEGGVVFGARFDENWQVLIDYAETMEGVKPFMGSKYVQARTATSYKNAERFLKQGRKVLFSGSPCQIAGLHHYLRKQYNNLTTADFVCHGVPSPKVWKLYLDEIVSAVSNVKDVNFRNKDNGWKKFNFSLSYNEGNKTISISSFHGTNHYMRAFLNNMILRPSCYECKAKKGCSHSDITIADFWKINREIPEMDDDKGTGLVLVNTDKGQAALNWNKVKIMESSFDVAKRYNDGLSEFTKPHPKRESFFAHLHEAESVIDLINKYLRPTLKKQIRIKLRKCIQTISTMFCSIGGGKEKQTVLVQNVPSLIQKVSVVSVCFRNKDNGWKTYKMEIQLDLN